MLVYRRPWALQPQYPVGIDRSHPLSRGLIRAWNHGLVGGPEALNAISTSRLTYQASSVFLPAANGVRSTTAPVTSGGVSGTDCGPITELQSISAYSVFSLAIPDGVSARQSLWTAGGTFGLGCGYTTASRVFAEPINNGSSFTTEAVTGFFVDAQEIAVGFTYDDGVTAGRCFFYKNGQLASQSNPSGTGAVAASLSNFSVGGIGGSQLYTWKGLIRLTLVWNRALTAPEHAAVARNPWQLFAPLPRRLWMPDSGAVADTLMPQCCC